MENMLWRSLYVAQTDNIAIFIRRVSVSRWSNIRNVTYATYFGHYRIVEANMNLGVNNANILPDNEGEGGIVRRLLGGLFTCSFMCERYDWLFSYTDSGQILSGLAMRSCEGLKKGDRIVEVNGVNVEGDLHAECTDKIRSVTGQVKLLVVDTDADDYFRQRQMPMCSKQTYVSRHVCPSRTSPGPS